MKGGATLDLLGDCLLTPTKGEAARIEGARSQVAVAIAALSETGLSDAKLARLLCQGSGRELTEGGVRTMRHRLPPTIKAHLGRGANRWRFPDVEVDYLRLRAEVVELQRASTGANGDALRSALMLAAKPLLPDVGDEEGQGWLAGRREELQKLRVDLIQAAILWADERADPWADDLRLTLRELLPDSAPARPIVRRKRWSSPEVEVTNIGRADTVKLIGREHELDLLRRRFAERVTSQVIVGEGGIGKSDLALTFVNRHSGDYRVSWKLNAESEVELSAGLRRLGKKLGIPSAETTSLIASEDADSEQFLADFGDYFRSGYAGQWLLLFDNVVHPAALEEVWRHLPSNGHVLITSQWQDWGLTDARTLPLWGLEKDDAMELLAETSGRIATGEDSLAICRFLNFHPMLLKHAGLTMYMDGIGSTEYLTHLQTRSDEAIEKWPELDLPRRHAISTYRLAIERAVEAVPGAGPLIEIAACLAPDLIDETVLHQGIAGHVPELPDEDALLMARRALRSRSLIQDYQRTESFTVHRVMQAVVRLRLGREGVIERLGTAVDALRRSLPAADAEYANQRRRGLAPHIETVIAHVEYYRADDLRARTAELASNLGLFRRAQSEWQAAETAHQKAVELSVNDTDHRAAAMRGVRLANVIRQRGRFDEAETALAAALPRLREAAPADDVDLAYALTVQARILRARPDSAPRDAGHYLEESLQILRGHADGLDDHRGQLSRTLNYHAVLLRQLGEYERAEEQSRQGFELLTGRSPEEWIEDEDTRDMRPKRLVAIHLRSLGNVWRLLGHFRDARDAHDRARAIISDLFDDDHTDIGRCLDSLGRVQREYGDFPEALESFTRAREISDYRFGDSYPHAATALTNIALTLREMGSLEEALASVEEAVAIYRHNYGDTWDEGAGELRNEHTAWAIYARAELLTALAGRVADPAEREELLERPEREQRQVLLLRQKVYGRSGHPHIASSLQSLADIAALRGKPLEAVRLNRQAREIRIRAFGDDSYWVARSDARLGELCDSPEDRRRHLQAAEEVWADQLAAGHPWLRHVRQLLDKD